MMKVILQEDVPHLGLVGDLVNVKDGFGRNFLLPQGKAVLASPRSVRELNHQKRLAEHRRAKATAEAQTVKKSIEKLSIVMQARVAQAPLNAVGQPVNEVLQKLFGTITNRDIAAVLKDQGLNVQHRRISFVEGAPRTVGKFTAQVRLDGGIVADVPFWVIPKDAPDVEVEKKRVEAAQEAMKKLEAEIAARDAEAARQQREAERREAEKREADKKEAAAKEAAAAAAS